MKEANGPRFPTTDWSMLARAADAAAPGHGDSLDQLLRRYMPVMRGYLLRQKCLGSDQADDLLQGFVTDKLIERQLLSRADPHRGKFRNLLVRSLEHFLIDAHRRRNSSKQSPQIGPLARLDENVVAAADSSSDPSVAFDRTWARQVMADALDRTRQRCEATNRSLYWQAFEYRMLHFGGDESPISYQDLVSRFGFTSPIKASNALITAKRIFTRMLREVLSEYAVDGEDIDEELRDLRKNLGGSAAFWPCLRMQRRRSEDRSDDSPMPCSPVQLRSVSSFRRAAARAPVHPAGIVNTSRNLQSTRAMANDLSESSTPGGQPIMWIGRYRLLAQLGTGGMGIVYEAEQERPRRHVALKLMRGALASASARTRFEAEAEHLAKLHHAKACSVAGRAIVAR